MRRDLVKEIRINRQYTQYFLSEFPDSLRADSLAKESTPVIVKRTLFTSDYMKKLSIDSASAILPPNCRYIEPVSKGHLVVIEDPPSIRTIKIAKTFEREASELSGKMEEYGYRGFQPLSSNTRRFTLAFPYVIFIMVIENNRVIDGLVFMRTQQMRGMSDYLFKAPLTNISDNQRVCFGDANQFKTNSLTQTVQNLQMVFWSADFNTDYTYNYQAYAGVNSEFGNYLRWEYLSSQNPLFIYDAKWVRMDENLGQMIDRIKRSDNLHGRTGMSYSKATSLIFEPAPTGTEAPISLKRPNRTRPLFHDIANGMYVGDYFLSIGDPFTDAKQESVYYIDSFIGFSEGGNLKYIMVDKGGKKFMMKLTKKVMDYIAVSNKALRYVDNMVLPNGLEVKTGDILVFKNKSGSEHYGAVDFIRLGRDGKMELKVGRDYYIAENIDAAKFEMEKPTIYNLELKKGDEYIYIRDAKGSSPFPHASKVEYTKVRVGSSGTIDFEFDCTDPYLIGMKHRLPITRGDRMASRSRGSQRIPRLFRKSDVRTFSGVFRIGKKLYFIQDMNDRAKAMKDSAWELPNGAGLAYDTNFSLRRPRKGMISELVKDNVFRLEGHLLDLEFKVGDKVVAAEWQNPHEILKVKEIAGFSIINTSSESRCEDLYFILSDKDGNLSKIKYIYGYSGICHIGKVRKITNTWNRVSAGTKIICNEPGYVGFPKKSVNIIIGFIYDTGGDEPLVLCSNGQTLWFNDMMDNFKRVTIRSKKWGELKHTPMDLSKIKPQPGDIINGTKEYKTTEGYLMVKLPTYRGVRAQIMEYYTGYPESYGMDARFTREYIYDCIPNPRIRPAQIDTIGTVPAFPNFHGLFHYSEKSDYNFINEPGRIINVPSSD